MIAFGSPPPPQAKAWPLVQRRDIWSRITWGVKVALLLASLPKDMERRRRCRWDFFKFCETYFPAVFFDPNRFHREFAVDLQRLILSKSPMTKMKALAAPRGVGKTTLAVLAIIWATIYGHSKFAIVFSSTGPNAAERLSDIKSQILRNELLFEDFPEICGPVREFGGDARAAAGARPGYPWSNDLIRLPNGAYIASFGMDSAVAGRLKDFQRPDLLLVDDMETVDSVRSPAETEKLRYRLFQEVMGLPGAGNHAALFLICTIKVKGCISDQLTNAEVYSEWRGKRYAALEEFPVNEGLWNVFMEYLQPTNRSVPEPPTAERSLSDEQLAQYLEIPWQQWLDFTDKHRAALRFYGQHKTAMDDGAKLLDAKRLPLREVYYQRATKGETAWLCEIQNSPPDDESVKDLQLDMELLARRAIGGPRRIVPDWAQFVTFAIDLGKFQCYWQADAWDESGRTSCLIDQGAQDTNLNQGNEFKMTDDEQKRKVLVTAAIQYALEQLELRAADGFIRANGEVVLPAIIGADCGGTSESLAWYSTVMRFCFSRPRWYALKGSEWRMSIAERALGRSWLCEAKNNDGRRHDCNSDAYKSRVYQSLCAPLTTSTGSVYPGTRIFHKDTPREYLRHLTAEKWVEELKAEARAGKELKVGWNHVTSIPNHWWDTSWNSTALAEIYRHYRIKAKPPPRSRPQVDRNQAYDPSLG